MSRQYKDFMKDWDYDDPVNTRTIFLEYLRTAKEENDLEVASEIQTQIARTYSLDLDFKQAHSVIDIVEKVLSEISNPVLASTS